MSNVMGRSALQPPTLKLHLALNAAALSAAAALMAYLAAQGGGPSSLRIALIGVSAILALAVAVAAAYLHAHPVTERRMLIAISNARPQLSIALALVFLGFWCLTWLPPQSTGAAHDYFLGLYPLILCGLLASGSALVLIALPGGHSTAAWWIRYFGERRAAVRIAIFTLAAFGLAVLLTIQFGVLGSNEPYWYGAGVPLLAAQVLTATLVAALALRLEDWQGTRRLSPDLIFFLLIWAAAALLWAARPVPASYWVTLPRAPNFENYPFSDMMTFDVASQFALIGQGIYNGVFFDRALYMSFLVYLHIIGGQNYQQLMSIQAALFAVFPALLYLVGKQLHSRAAGLTLAALVLMRGLTSLDASAWIDTSTFKHMLTDFPTAIGMAACLVLLLDFLRAPSARRSSLFWASGILGLTSLLRPHVLAIIVAVAILPIALFWSEWRKGLGTAGIAVLAFLAGVLPWMLLGPSSGSLIALYGQRIQDVIEQRYPQAIPSLAPTGASAPVVSTPDLAGPPPATAPGQAPSASPPAAAAPLPTAAPATQGGPPPPREDRGIPFIADHFLHNLLTSALIFPSSPQFLAVRDVVKEGDGFWLPDWDGSMGPLSAFLLLCGLALAAFGIGIAVQRNRWRGLTPLAAFLLYIGMNAAARTSGGRYIVPVDWILVAYFAIGLTELVGAWGSFLKGGAIQRRGSGKAGQPPLTVTASRRASSSAQPASRLARTLSRPVTVLVLLLLLGELVPLAGVLFPRKYADTQAPALVQELQAYLPQAIDAGELEAFLQQRNAIVMQGRLLYPIHYRRGEGEPTVHAPYAPRNYPRSVFMLVGPEGSYIVRLAAARTVRMPNASDAIVLGCIQQEQDDIVVQALAVALPDEQAGYVRSPAADLRCPVPNPICDSNSNCR